MGSSTNTHMHALTYTLTCSCSHSYIKLRYSGKAKRMIVYVEKIEQQPSHLTHVYFIVSCIFIANQLLLRIYGLFFVSLTLSLAYVARAYFRTEFSLIHVQFIFAYLGFDCISSSARLRCHSGRCSAAAAAAAIKLQYSHGNRCALVYVFYSRSFHCAFTYVYVTKNERCVLVSVCVSVCV